MDELFGLPAHPLVVHAPVVLLPLAVVGAVAMMLRPSWYRHFRWPVLAIAAIGTLGAIFAAGSGEELEEGIERTEGREAVRAVHEHAEAGEAARTLAILFLVAIAVYVLVPWFLARRASAGDVVETTADRAAAVGPAWLRPLLMLFVGVTAVGSLVTIVDAGHSGADAVWGGEGDARTEVDDDDDGDGDDGD